MNRIIKLLCCLLFSVSLGGRYASAYAEEHNPFMIPEKLFLPSGVIYLSYPAALKNAQEHQKLGIIVFFCEDPFVAGKEHADLWNDFFEEGMRTPPSLLQEMNVVLMKRGIVSPMLFYPKLDPMIFHMSDFQERFPSIDLSHPSVVFISVDREGNDEVQQVRPIRES